MEHCAEAGVAAEEEHGILPWKISCISARAFKSFDSKIVVSPLSCFTCIVGPNGTGKSVIGEALAFALGASPRALRVTSFSSLLSRNSTSTSAKVSVQLQRRESGEKVKISRVLSGSSTKFFWKDAHHAPKREISFRDLSQKLLDFNVSANHIERFMVMQNRVCAKIKQPRDLTKHLELVIGTNHFEEEIEATNQRIDKLCVELESVQQNLWDIELKRKELNPEVEKWRKFTDKLAQFFERKMRFLRRQKDRLQTKLKALNEEKKEKTSSLLGVQENIKISKQSSTKLNQEHSDLCKSLQECYKKKNMAKKEYESLRIQMIKEEVRLRELEEEVSKLKEKYVEEQISFAERETEANRALGLIVGEINELEKQKEEISKEKEVADHKKALLFTSESGKLQDDDTFVQEEAFLTTKLSRLQERLRLFNEKRRKQIAHSSELAVEIEAMKLALEERNKFEREQTRNLLEKEAELSTIQDEIDQINEKTVPLIKEDIHKTEVEMKYVLKKLADDGSREEKLCKEDEAADALMQMLKGKLHGRITGLFTVGNNMEKAVNSILCHLTNPATTFVVEDREAAHKIISYFVENRIGTTTCEILPELRTRFRKIVIGETGPYVKPVLKNLEFDERFEPVFVKYFGKWCIAQDLCAATSHFQRKQGYSEMYNVVTENGDIFKMDGEVIAANWRTNVKSAVKTRSDRMKQDESTSVLISKELLGKITNHKNELESILGRQLDRLEHLKSQKVVVYELIQNLKQSANSQSNSSSEAILNKLEDQQKKLNLIKQAMQNDEGDKLAYDIETIKEQLEALRINLRGAENTATSDLEVLDLVRKIKELDDIMRSYSKTIQEKRLSYKTIANQLEVLKSGGNTKPLLSEKSKALTLLREKFLATEEQLQDVERKLKRDTEIETMESKKLQLEKDIAGFSKQEKALRSKEVSTRKELNSLDESVSITESQLQKVLEALHDSSNPQAHKKICLEQLDQSIEAYADVAEYYEGVILAQEESMLIEARREIHADALEEDVKYRKKESHFTLELERRNEQIEAQRNQKEKLENERFQIFTVTVRKLNEELSDIYGKLTTHGDAYLSFTEEKKLLFTNGVNLQVRPDRYKWRAFNSLSGGQQALASLSLSFSLQKLFPSPFYFFDEIDASLDTKNARLIAEYIKNQSSAQYIVVSHRPQLYEMASSLVGVYHYRGASTCVAVKV